MYGDPSLKVKKIENGFLLEVCVPYKPKDSAEDDKTMPMGMGYGEKEIYAKDAQELGQKISALVPMLDMEFDGESAFEAAFKMAGKTGGMK